MKIVENPDKEFARDIKKKIKENGGYCICAIEKSKDFKCPCKDFRDQVKDNIEGSCNCGLYIAE